MDMYLDTNSKTRLEDGPLLGSRSGRRRLTTTSDDMRERNVRLRKGCVFARFFTVSMIGLPVMMRFMENTGMIDINHHSFLGEDCLVDVCDYCSKTQQFHASRRFFSES